MRTAFLVAALCGQAAAGTAIPTTYVTAAGGYGLDMPVTVNRNPNGLTASASNSTVEGSNSAAYQSAADLAAGTLKLFTNGEIVTPVSNEPIGSSFASMGDTFTLGYATGAGGLHLGMDLNFSGTWSASGAGLTNWSFLSIYLLNDGSFDTENATAPANVIGQVDYGFGPDYIHGPFPAAIGGVVGIPGNLHVSLPGTLDSLPSRFQVLVVAQILFAGDVDSGTWNADLYHTIEATLLAPEGVTLTSVGGGLPTAVEAAVPEPGSLLLAGGAVAAVWIRKRFAPAG